MGSLTSTLHCQKRDSETIMSHGEKINLKKKNMSICDCDLSEKVCFLIRAKRRLKYRNKIQRIDSYLKYMIIDTYLCGIHA